MFEQSVITTQRRPWTMAASLTLQCAFAGTIVLASVISIQRLPLISLPTPMRNLLTGEDLADIISLPVKGVAVLA